jgi:hypothetical protein
MSNQDTEYPPASRQPWPAGPPPLLGYELSPQPIAEFRIALNDAAYAASLDQVTAPGSNSMGGRLLVSAIAFVILYTISFFYMANPPLTLESYLVPLFVTALIGIPIILTFYFALRPSKSATLKMLRELEGVESELTYLVYREGLACRWANSAFVGRWVCFDGAKRLPDGFIILVNAQPYYWLPLAFMTVGDPDEFGQILASNYSNYETIG